MNWLSVSDSLDSYISDHHLICYQILLLRQLEWEYGPGPLSQRTRSSWLQKWVWEWNNQWPKGSIIRLLTWDLFFIRREGEHIFLSGSGRTCVWNALYQFLLLYGKNPSTFERKHIQREKETSGRLGFYDFQILGFTHSWGQSHPRPFSLYESQNNILYYQLFW